MATFNELAAFKSQLQRKALVGVVFVADYATAALAALTQGTTPADAALADLTGYASLGKLTADGISIPNDIEEQEQRGWGDLSSPSRIDIVAENVSMNFTAMESNLAVWDAFYNVDMGSVTPDPTSGEITFDKPAVPELRDKRTLALFRDVNKADGKDIWHGMLFPKSNLRQNGEQTWANNETGFVYPLTSRALVDDTEGTAVRLFWGGPGLAGLTSDMGFGA